MHSLIRLLPQIWKLSGYFSGILWLFQVRKLVKKIKPDILHAHYIGVPAYLGVASGFHPLILTAWGSDVLDAPKSSRLTAFMVKFVLGKADITLTTSDYLKEYLLEKFSVNEDRLLTMPWGIDLVIFYRGYTSEVKELRTELGIDDGSFVILSPRNLKDLYRIQLIVQAMPVILAKYPNVILLILKGAAQDREYENGIEQLAVKLGVNRNVSLIRGGKKPQEMAVLYNASDAFVSIPRTDGFASTIMEGMTCGVIPIVGDLIVYHQYLKHDQNALFVNPEDPQDIADKLIYCIEHCELKEKFYDINVKIIEEREDWNKNAKQMEELYEKLLIRNLNGVSTK